MATVGPMSGVSRTRARPTAPRALAPSPPPPPREVAAPGVLVDGFESTSGGWAALLSSAGSQARSAGPEGREKLLTVHQRRRVETLLAQSPAATRAALEELVAGMEGAAVGVLLRAMAARADALGHSPAALVELRNAARQLAALSPAQVLRQATSLDLDSTRNDSHADPMPLWERRGVIHARVGNTQAADNDGLFQRFTASCGTTVLQMMLAEADPVYALALHQDGLNSTDTHGATADFQRRFLEAGGGVALGRQEASLRSRVRNMLGRLGRSGAVSAAQKDALLGHALRGGALNANARRALRACRRHYDGFPSDNELSQLRAQRLPDRDEGLGSVELLNAVHQVLTPLTGVSYAIRGPADGFARGQARHHLDDVAGALAEGMDVPFGISEPAHWMLLSAVSGKAPNRAFLISDPDGGRTAWVSQKDLCSGVFADRQFHLSMAHERPYVDTFLLPVT